MTIRAEPPPEITEMRRLLDELAAQDVCGMGAAELEARLRGLRQVVDRAECEFARCLAPFDRGRMFEASGAVSAVSWLRQQTDMDSNGASQRRRVARQLGDLPETAKGFQDGELSYGHVVAIARTVATIDPEQIGRADAELAHFARRLDPDRLRRAGEHLRHCLDPDGALIEANRAHERRRLHVSKTIGGMVILDGMLDAEAGASVLTALDAATPSPNGNDGRTAAQRRADALTGVCERVLEHGQLPDTGGLRPQLTVTTTAATLVGMGGGPAGDVEHGSPIPGESVRRLACDATVTHAVLDDREQPLSIGRASRVVPPPMRRALNLRDKGCRFPGCDAGSGWADAHHVNHWVHGGETRLDNLILLCRAHHRMIHDHAWSLSLDPDTGDATIRPP